MSSPYPSSFRNFPLRSPTEFIPLTLAIGGSDSSGGAGIQADLKTFASFGVHGLSVLTAVTAQSPTGVHNIYPVPPDFVAEQLDSVLGSMKVESVKCGMLYTPEVVEVVSDRIQKYRLSKFVVDPILWAGTGESLLQPQARTLLSQLLFPLAFLLIPNIPEAEAFTGQTIRSVAEMKEACRILYDKGSQNILTKGGHLSTSSFVIDVLYDGKNFYEFPAVRVPNRSVHGAGCVFSAAITSGLSKNLPLLQAIQQAKEFITHAIQNSFPVGDRFFLFPPS